MDLANFYIEATILNMPLSYVREQAIKLEATSPFASVFFIENKIMPCVIDVFTKDIESKKKTKGSFNGGNSCYKINSALGCHPSNLGCGSCYHECIKKIENKELQIVKK